MTITQHRDEETQPQYHTDDHNTARRWRDADTITHWGPLHSTKMKRHSHNHTLRTITQHRDEETQPQSHTKDHYTALRWRDTATITHLGPLHSTEMKRHSHNHTLRTITQHWDEETQPQSQNWGPLHSTDMKRHSHNHTLRTITQHWDEETQPQSHTEDHYTAPRWRDTATITHWGPLHSTEMKRHSHNHTWRTITQHRDEDIEPHHTLRTITQNRDEDTQP